MRHFLSIPGINADVGSVDNWPQRFCRRVEREGRGYADCFIYGVGAFDQGFWLNKHKNQVARIISDWIKPGDELVVVAHSRGCLLALEALKAFPNLGAFRLHLLNAAAAADCEENGLNLLVNRGQAREVFVWTSQNDEALKVAPWVGMGQLGLVGPQNMTTETHNRTRVIPDDTCGHSTLLTERWDETFAKITEE